MKRLEGAWWYPDSIKSKLLSQKDTLCLCVYAVFFWGLLAHAYGFLNSNFSHDVLNAFVATEAENLFKLQLGRYFVPFFRELFRGAVSVPWLIGLMGLFWTAAAVFFFVRIFDIRSKTLIIFTAGIMTTNITYISQIATYIHEFDINAFALVLSILAVYLWNEDKGLLCGFAGSICLMLAIGIYQAYITVTITLIIWKSVMDLFARKAVPAVFFHGLRGILLILMGAVFYLLAGQLIHGLAQIQVIDRTDPFDFGGENPVALYLGLIKPALYYLMGNLVHKAYGGGILTAAVYTLCGVLCIQALGVFIVKKYELPRILLILCLVALIPVAMLLIYFLAQGTDVHELMIYSFWFFYIFILMFAFRLCDADMLSGWKSELVKVLCCALVFGILWKNVELANTGYIKKDLEADAALSTMTRVVSMLEQQEAYVAGQTPVAFFDDTGNDAPRNGMEGVSEIVGLNNNFVIPVDTSTDYYNAYKAYFEYVLHYPLEFCPNDVHFRLDEDPRVHALPAFPDPGCMEMIDGIMVIKMG